MTDVPPPQPQPAKPLLTALKGGATPVPPIWLMRQAGRYLPEYRALRARAGSFLDLCFTPELASEVTLQPIRRYGLDGAILFSDILVIPHALGQTLWFETGAGPRLEPLTAPEEVTTRLIPGRLHDVLAPVYETLRRVRPQLPQQTALLGFAGAPWTVASYMIEGGTSRDFATAKRWAYGDPVGFGRLVDLLVEATAEYLSAQLDAGAEAVQIFDSWAGSLSAKAQRRWSLAPIRDLVARVKARHPQAPVIVFPRGVGPLYAEFADSLGADALALDSAIPLDWAQRHLRPKVALQGNLDPIHLVAGGAGQAEATAEILEALAGPGFVFNLGHGVVPQTPPEHVATLIAQVRGTTTDGTEE